jgi:hypothetical protein
MRFFDICLSPQLATYNFASQIQSNAYSIRVPAHFDYYHWLSEQNFECILTVEGWTLEAATIIEYCKTNHRSASDRVFSPRTCLGMYFIKRKRSYNQAKGSTEAMTHSCKVDIDYTAFDSRPTGKPKARATGDMLEKRAWAQSDASGMAMEHLLWERSTPWRRTSDRDVRAPALREMCPAAAMGTGFCRDGVGRCSSSHTPLAA